MKKFEIFLILICTMCFACLGSEDGAIPGPSYLQSPGSVGILAIRTNRVKNAKLLTKRLNDAAPSPASQPSEINQKASSDNVSNFSSWEWRTEPLPMSISNAIQAATNYFPEICPEDHMALNGIALRRIKKTKKWHYRTSFQSVTNSAKRISLSISMSNKQKFNVYRSKGAATKSLGKRRRLLDSGSSVGFKYNSTNWIQAITSEDLHETPQWNPNKEDPPLSMKDAISIAEKSLEHIFPTKESYWPTMVSTSNIGHPELFVYRVSFDYHKADGSKKARGPATVYVGMDGKAPRYMTTDEFRKVVLPTFLIKLREAKAKE